MTRPAEVSVCVCTFRRPLEVGRLLACLAEQQAVNIPWEVVVVDNDAHLSAGAVLKNATADFPSLQLRSFVAPVQGIARARNVAVREAVGRWLAFIDDDEVPGVTWLATMLEAANRWRADGVLGPVLSELPSDTPQWIRRGGFFDRPRHPSGTIVPEGELRTGNLLISSASLSKVERAFDESLNLSGGEDWVLLRTLRQAGLRFIWCDSAPVTEHVSPSRIGLVPLLRRASGGGEVYARARWRSDGWRAVGPVWVGACASVVLGLVGGILFTPFGFHRGARYLMRGASGLGRLLALTPLRQQRYLARPD